MERMEAAPEPDEHAAWHYFDSMVEISREGDGVLAPLGPEPALSAIPVAIERSIPRMVAYSGYSIAAGIAGRWAERVGVAIRHPVVGRQGGLEFRCRACSCAYRYEFDARTGGTLEVNGSMVVGEV